MLLIGFGSIGKRHYRNLKFLGYNNISVYDPADSQFKNEKIDRLKDLTPAALRRFEVAYICNPSHLHLSTAIKCARAGLHLFIEKPLSHNLKGVAALLKICGEKKLINLVACNIRFHPAVIYIKDYLEKNKLGGTYLIHLQTGLYLPFWRPRQDYRKNYAAKKASGGGIILDGGIHNFDLLFWLNNFSPVQEYKLIYNKVSNLKIETEDCFVASFNFRNKIQASILGDYLQKPYSWTIKIVGAKGNLAWDFKENIVWLIDEKGKKMLKQFKNYDSNKMYLDECRYFMRQVEKKQKTFNNIERAARVLKYLVKR